MINDNHFFIRPSVSWVLKSQSTNDSYRVQLESHVSLILSLRKQDHS